MFALNTVPIINSFKYQELTEEAQEIATRAQAEEARLNVELERLQKELQETLASQRSKPAEKPRPVRKVRTFFVGIYMVAQQSA